MEEQPITTNKKKKTKKKPQKIHGFLQWNLIAAGFNIVGFIISGLFIAEFFIKDFNLPLAAKMFCIIFFIESLIVNVVAFYQAWSKKTVIYGHIGGIFGILAMLIYPKYGAFLGLIAFAIAIFFLLQKQTYSTTTKQKSLFKQPLLYLGLVVTLLLASLQIFTTVQAEEKQQILDRPPLKIDTTQNTTYDSSNSTYTSKSRPKTSDKSTETSETGETTTNDSSSSTPSASGSSKPANNNNAGGNSTTPSSPSPSTSSEAPASVSPKAVIEIIQVTEALEYGEGDNRHDAKMNNKLALVQVKVTNASTEPLVFSNGYFLLRNADSSMMVTPHFVEGGSDDYFEDIELAAGAQAQSTLVFEIDVELDPFAMILDYYGESDASGNPYSYPLR
ncbi:hypothetical protein M2139_002745 [Enterococcus sp. PF1-24]|uniref:DUF4352 domain-containing protein n=1 Tax=unclassified Enterococcus TaxID=2608891 RepID=UPI0024767E14|nr:MULTISPECIES: DUF4352 domain-containing protein [unclassified Enterococcus]MDH6365716.1 hypothetical protein [Enterococcus sp. PFB1-1]MDH6402816.1 hypothetical protein [Enterococcus sp. PF1-24]